MHGDYQFANVMYQHGAPARLAALVDWEMGTVGDPKLDLAWMVQSWPSGPDDTAAMSYVDMRGMPSRDQVVAHYAEVSGRQVDDLDYYLVLAKWKLAIVLEQGFQRAGDDEKLLAFGPVVSDSDGVCGRARRVHRLPRLSGPMLAAVCPAYGPPEVVRVEERDDPTLTPGHAMVRVQAAAVNFPDVLLIADRYQISVPPPFVPGSEYAGVIEELAGEPLGFAVGDRVVGAGLHGAFAERVAVSTAGLSRIPVGIAAPVAAAFGVAHRTAQHTLRSVARISPGDELIVLGAGGGVGLAAVQLGAAFGARVTAVASSREKLDVAASYGATGLIDHRDGELRAALREALPAGADAVVDPVGGGLSEPALRALRRGGRFVTVGYASGVIPRIPLNLILVKGIRVVGFQFQDVPAAEFTRNEDELTTLLTTGRVAPHIGASYSLRHTAQALRHVADGRAIGKVLIEVS